MNKWFAGIKTVEELRKRYRELLKKYHPDNDGGSVEITQEINTEYDRLFAILSKESKTDGESTAYDDKAENEAFKAVINDIIHINADIEIIGSWVWVHGGYEYRELLKSVGFKFAPKKKCWCWHSEAYHKRSRKTLSLDDIRNFYGSTEVETDGRKRLQA